MTKLNIEKLTFDIQGVPNPKVRWKDEFWSKYNVKTLLLGHHCSQLQLLQVKGQNGFIFA
jgi:hypothetical protein